MSWLFKDPIVTVAWLSFDHAQSNSKKWPKKVKLPQMSFFLEKRLIKVSCTHILAPFILQNFKKVLRAYPELGRCSIFEPKIVHFSWIKFCRTNHYYYFTFIYLLPLFIVQNLKRNSYSESRVMKMPHFWGQNGLFASFPLPPKKKEKNWKKIINIIFI